MGDLQIFWAENLILFPAVVKFPNNFLEQMAAPFPATS
jgi:hypothetical protein